MVVEIINQGIGYVRQGLDVVRDFLMNITGWLPWDEQLSVMIVFLVVSLLVGHIITKRFVTRPLQLSYLPWFLIISISIFLNLMYL